MPINYADLRRQHLQYLRKTGEGMDEAARRISALASDIAKGTKTITNRTGAGRQGWYWLTSKIQDGAQGELRNRVRHMFFQEEGTGVFGPKHAPYYIVPRRAKALRFVAGGKLVFTRRVKHYGVHPRFIGRAAIFGRQAPFYGQDHSSNIATIERVVGKRLA
jgi:hypothetical protein